MAKIMTAEVLFNELKSGRVTMDSTFTVSVNAWKKGGAGSGGSAMFAKVNEPVRVEDLLRALSSSRATSGNRDRRRDLGNRGEFRKADDRTSAPDRLTKSTFRNATGYSEPDQKVTVRELAKLSLHMIETYPEYYKMFGEKEFTWNKIRQVNRNPLLTMDIGADGLKTGNVDESGYGLVGSAVQNGQRLVVVVNGMKTARDRAAEIPQASGMGLPLLRAHLLFEPGKVVGDAEVFGGDRRSLPLVSERPVRVLVRRGDGERLSARIVYQGPLKAPIRKGAQVAKIEVTRGDTKALEMPLYASEDVEVGTCASALSTACSRSAPVGCAARCRMCSAGSDGRDFHHVRRRGGGREIHPDTRLRARIESVGDAGGRTREPGGSPYAEEIRAFILDGKAKELGPFAEAVLFTAARIDHLDQTIGPALRARDLRSVRPLCGFDPRLSGRIGRCGGAVDQRAGARRAERVEARPDPHPRSSRGGRPGTSRVAAPSQRPGSRPLRAGGCGLSQQAPRDLSGDCQSRTRALRHHRRRSLSRRG